MSEYWLDTNIIIRFVTADHPVMSEECRQLIHQAHTGEIRLKVASMVLAECCWVLKSSMYAHSPRDIAHVLLSFLAINGIEAEESEVVMLALEDFANLNVDFIDAYLSRKSKQSGANPIITCNKKDFDKLNAKHISPAFVI